MANFSLIICSRKVEECQYPFSIYNNGGWTTQLVSSHCPLVSQDYPQASLSKLQKLLEGVRIVIFTSNLLSYPPFNAIIIKQNFT